jgi:hypothetical protein
MIKSVFVIILAALWFLIDYLRKRNHSKKKYKLPDELKRRYKKISVVPAGIEILTNEYCEEDIEGGDYKIKTIDALYDANRNYSQVNKFASVIVYYYSAMGKKCRFSSETIDLSPEEIQRKLQKNGIIDIYFDEKNLKYHYFDLSFLAD